MYEDVAKVFFTFPNVTSNCETSSQYVSAYLRDLEEEEEIFELMLLRRRKFKRWSVRPQNTSRVDNVEFSLVQKLREMDEEEFFGHSRMPRSKYDSLAGRILFSPPVRKHKADT